MGVLTAIKNRGVQDCLTAAVDGLTGFPDTVNTVFPDTEVQLCAPSAAAPPQKASSHGQEFGKICFLQRPESAGRQSHKKIYLAPV
jgi:hypothetical protein